MLDYMTEGPLSTLDSLPPDTFNALVAPLWNFLAPSQQPGELTADILFVIGNIDLAIPRHAAKLFMEGYAPAVLSSQEASHHAIMTARCKAKPTPLPMS